MQERDVESYLNKRVKEANGMPMKFVSPGLRGVPDRIVLFPGGRIVFIELKAPGEKPNKQQAYRIKQLQDRGAIVRIIDSINGVDNLMWELKFDEI